MVQFYKSPILCVLVLGILQASEGVLRIGVPEGGAGGAASPAIIAHQIRAYWKCYESVNVRPLVEGTEPFCPATFDGWGCWDATAAGHTAQIPCPNPEWDNTTKLVQKRCSEDGEWETNEETGEEKVDYSVCGINVTSGDADLLFRLIKELSSLESSPYEDPWTAEAFDTCLETVLAAPRVQSGSVYCPRTFDGWGCWNDTAAGRTAYIPCPSFITGFLPQRSAHKECTSDGTWFRHPSTNKTWSNYTTCVDREDLTFRQRIMNVYIAGYSTSVFFLLISLAIFFYFRSVQCTRITIHKQLFVSFIINNIMWIIWYTEVAQRPEVLLANGIPCKILHVLVQLFLVSNYFWMFCEGLYLHTLLVVAFVAEDRLIKWFYLVGWGIPLLIIITYTSVRSSVSDDIELPHCWIEESKYYFIITVPVCISMLLNLMFLVNIVRVLVTKLRAVNSPDTHQTKKAVRATLILIPLLGLHFLVTPFRPDAGAPGEAIYEIVTAIVTSLQGLSVALLFCFFNGEVMTLVRKKWHQTRLMHSRRMSYAATTVSHAERSCSNGNSVPATKSLLALV